MIALGNDVVDLNEAPKNGEAYYARLTSYALNHSELKLLRQDDHLTLRLIWAIKEASYKSSNKTGNLRKFNPKDFIVDLIEGSGKHVSGYVTHENSKLNFRGKVADDFIHIVAYRNLQNVIFQEGEIPISGSLKQSTAVRNLIQEAVEGDFCIQKDVNGIPWMICSDRKRTEISLSHHGRFGAWAIAT